ncbi:hypothetical protein [Lelliottia wanjuensis]|uniref:hypothetical protein n=1 Tax=Lelliottia wanjuensis TaxID=3050585 RepID=UPI00254FAA10|nr:hypothetical protein [Lelliottia sp. V104_15]MDK9607083.1 hypothetical protein [Lelliottia sp. V104_15]
MKTTDEAIEKALLQFGKGKTPEQRQRNQRNLVALRKMIDAVRIADGMKKLKRGSFV